MADLEQLKQKYATVLQFIERRNVSPDHLHVRDDKLVIHGAAPNEDIKNKVWNAIKAVDPGYSDLNWKYPSIPVCLPQLLRSANTQCQRVIRFLKSRTSSMAMRTSTLVFSRLIGINSMTQTKSNRTRN